MTYQGPPNYDRWSVPENTSDAATWTSPPPPKKSRRGWIIAAVVAAVILLGLCIGLFFAQGDPPTKQKAPARPTTTVTATKAPIKGNPPVATKPAAKTIGPGEFEVGKDVAVGKYRTAGAKPGVVLLCTYTVTGKTGDPVDFGAISNEQEQAYVTLKTGQTFKSSGCLPWVKQ